jgi:transcriptional regulator with XRE-family HTH domain
MSSKMTLSEKIKYLREEKGITQQKMADILNINRVTLTSYEIGRRVPDIYTLKKIADFFGVTVDICLTIYYLNKLINKNYGLHFLLNTFDVVILLIIKTFADDNVTLCILTKPGG